MNLIIIRKKKNFNIYFVQNVKLILMKFKNNIFLSLLLIISCEVIAYEFRPLNEVIVKAEDPKIFIYVTERCSGLFLYMNNVTKNEEGDGERAQTYEQQYIINSMRAAQMRISFNKSNTEEAKRETARATKDYFENYKTNAGLAKKIYGKTFSEVLDSDHSFCQYLNKELSIDR